MDLESIEEQRQTLELQLQKLRTALRHWQRLDFEYEGLKEEIQALPSSQPSEKALTDLSDSYDGSLVNEKEIREITGLTTSTPRKRDQIVDMIDRRIEYVTKNIETVSRQFYAAENKLEEFAFASSAASGANPRFDDEPSEPLPLLEIHEELDDHDNVISSELRNPLDETKHIFQALNSATDSNNPETQEDTSDATGSRRPPVRKKSVSFSADTKPPPEAVRTESSEGRKTVSFAPKVAVAPAAETPDTRSVSFADNIEEIPSQPAATPVDDSIDKQKDLRASFKPGEKVYEVNDTDDTLNEHIVLPENESAEDAQLRREMLQYHMNEVGNIVAEIDLEEADDHIDDHSDFTSSEYPEEDETPYTSGSDDEDEDDNGRATGRQVSDAYHEHMQALQARLIGNLGQQPSGEDIADLEGLDTKDVHRLVIRGDRASTSSAASSSSDAEKRASKKRVSFAEAVDIAEHEPSHKISKTEHDEEGILAETLIERPAGTTQVTDPSLEDEIVTRRELAAEYYRRRNDMVKQQGGFRQSEEDDLKDDEQGELFEEREDGKLRKVSRFKAARLRG